MKPDTIAFIPRSANRRYHGSRVLPPRSMIARFSFFMLLVLVVTGSTCRQARPLPPQPNLRWDGPKSYVPSSVTVQVSGFGINGSLDVLPAGPFPYAVTVTRDSFNDGTADAPAGYQISETVERLNLVSTGSSIGFVPAPIPPIFSQTQLGPALPSGSSTSAIFSFPVPACGIYVETLTLDGAGSVAESNETDNVAQHYFAVPGNMLVNITVNPTGPVRMWHDQNAPAGFAPTPAGGSLITHTFTITATSPGTTFHYNYRQAPFVGSQGSVGKLVGPPPVMPPSTPVAGPIVITFQVTPRTHDDAPATDILTETVQEHFVPKVTAITSDGCFVRQNAAQVTVAHPGR